MRVVMARKTAVRQRPTEDLETQVVRLSRQNTVLRKEIARLQVYRAMAYRDPLTGLWNRRYFEERLKEEFSRSQRAGIGRRFSVLIVDLNDFKLVNDQHGHPMGDAILKWVGEFLATHLRTHDVPCRTGGDEFTILLPDVAAEDCVRLMARLREQLDAANATRDLPVSLALGTASWPEVAASCEELLAKADEAMYADKRRQKAAQLQQQAPGTSPPSEATKGTRTYRTPRSRLPVPVA
jgi:diguanylate cyclase (GGDEF)-like protein